ncbi:MAG: alpha/beta hydrolase [Gammaproteobacteria bacterium]|nr:alpha/beta hydrolase [Gammaproteobacteria bacterium]MBQ0840978.1 alpha/beta hydrolase [Gammaproteobacteria bacterium]
MTEPKNTPLEHRFDNHGVTLAAVEWGDPEGLPVIALHGWLDNAASFAPLAERLQGIRLIALDLAGHGFSDHRSLDNTYNIWQDVADVYTVVEQLALGTFALLGHSRGAMIASLTAGTYPERVSHLGLIDSFVPQAIDEAELPQQLALSIADKHLRLAREPRIYATRDEAIASRTSRGETRLSLASAKLIAERGLRLEGEGFRWRADEKLKVASEVKLTQSIVKAFVERIACPSLLLLSDPQRMERFYGMEQYAPRLAIEIIAGSHHFHMEDTVAPTAQSLNDFYQTQSALATGAENGS